MKAASPFLSRLFPSRIACLLLVSSVAIAAGFAVGCGSGGNMSGSSGNMFSGNTSVMLLGSSTANDQLSQFNVQFTSITLTSQSGATATLMAMPTNAEFMHLYGTAEPLVTASVPQGIYTSATAIIGESDFTCVQLVPSANSLYISTYAYGSTPSSQVTVDLPTPITITGTAAVLSLNMLVSKSASYSSCAQTNPSDTYSINPTFNLTPVTTSLEPTNIENGKLTSLDGLIASIDATGDSVNVMAANGFSCGGSGGGRCSGPSSGPTWQVKTNGSTLFQGVANFSALAAGMPVDIDVAIQPDGSLLATRIAVLDTNTNNLSVSSGPLLLVAELQPTVNFFGQVDQGFLPSSGQPLSGGIPFSFGNATFQTSGQFTNLRSLPFSTSFNGANMFAGQNISYTSHALTVSSGPLYVPATTVTLMPQTINGTVTAVSSDGGFDTYTVALAPYDLFPNLAVQPGQTTVLTNPGSIVVYVDGNTQKLNSGSLVVGGLMRFNGLVFNDHGTLKMDAAWVNDGVAE